MGTIFSSKYNIIDACDMVGKQGKCVRRLRWYTIKMNNGKTLRQIVHSEYVHQIFFVLLSSSINIFILPFFFSEVLENAAFDIFWNMYEH